MVKLGRDAIAKAISRSTASAIDYATQELAGMATSSSINDTVWVRGLTLIRTDQETNEVSSVAGYGMSEVFRLGLEGGS